ncbi:uncharacterized protein LOC134246936 [Saccostrea cucullata]|uniref:uncharacterized protein LOC134246936 n=1 Tax=Saccostrea cuccullata TaxID=36930 RepID=UPI002ED29BFE
MADKIAGNVSRRFKNGRYKRNNTTATVTQATEVKESTVHPSIDHDYSRTFTAEDGWSDDDYSDLDNEDDFDENFLEPLHNDVQRNLLEWNEGKRVVELGVLASYLQKGCEKCGFILPLSNCVQERHYGLGSLLYILCKNGDCGHVTSIPTGKMHGKSIWDINTKLGAGVTSSGISFSALLLLLAVLNIPGLTSTTLKKRDRESGKAIETIASKTCAEACREEVDRNDGGGGIRVSADAGWQTRSSGRKYNSFSGHSVLIGDKTGKVLQYDVRCRKCRICYNAEKKGTTPAEHDCRKNWDGSAKSMEPDMIVGMIKGMKDNNISVSELVMDEDSTTIARAKKVCGEDLTKYSDRNHIKKTFTNKLYDLQRAKKYSQLRGKTIAHLKKCFSYALAQHQKNPEEMRKSLGAIVPHVYGDHSECRTWCKHRRNPDTYVPKNLPYSRYLTSEELRVDLENIMSTYVQQVQKVSNLGSTQACESFNNCVAYKHPKTLYLSGSESTCFRVAAAVAQKNVGKSYVTEVNKELSLSPDSQTQKVVERMDRKRALEKERYTSSAYKKRKFHLKKSSSQDQESKEVREGTTYATSVEMDQEEKSQDIESIPPPLPLPARTSLPKDYYTWIFFDLETTGLGLTSEIIEIGATRGNDTFQRFIKLLAAFQQKLPWCMASI